jgi:two-component system sensor histidine kinase/response regulator
MLNVMKNETNLHILIVDDVLKNLQITGQILKEAGYKISLAKDGKSALSLLEKEIPDLILLDVMMPGIDGFEVCRIIKKNEKLKEIPIIFITAFNQSDEIVKGFQVGGVDYITKPYNRDELLIRVKTHLDLSISKKKLIETIRTRDKLYSIIAHDIRSPFSAITAIVNSIALGDIDPNKPVFKEIMYHLGKSVTETSTLLNNLLSWTRIQIGAIKLEPLELPLKSILDDCVQLFSANAINKKITIDLVADENIWAYFDEVTMHTVFRNIISNSIKFTPEEGKISIYCVPGNEYVSVIFKDSGVGISKEAINKIFNQNEFYSSFGTNHEHGSGLGLFLVRDLLQQNNSVIDVESELGKGTTFIIKIPKTKNI